ncbi:lantibiotic dehydratase [Nonomuraea sp. NPDC050547]|uniref:lantibiotic dehydratase n=1 Tax=Nonomuraea sp. NPDC050547 TaxID=3364368 RepID=UPI0037934F69
MVLHRPDRRALRLLISLAHEPYVAGPVCFVRATTLPVGEAVRTHLDVEVTDPGSAGPLLARLREWWAIPAVPEAILLASASLYRSMDRLSQGGQPGHKELVRLFRSMAGYLLRMSGRPTPFGTMAGVAMARVAGPGEPAAARFGADHLRWARPDWGWLITLLADWESEPDVLECLTVVRGNLGFRRGDRWVNPHPQEFHPVPDSHPAESSVRLTPALAYVLNRTRTPIPATDLIQGLLAELPSATADGARAFVATLLRQEFLVSDLFPPFHEPAILDHVLAVLDRHPGAKRRRERLAELAESLAGYPSAPAGDRVPLLRGVELRMADLVVVDHAYLQAELRLDADVVISREVAREAERAADAAHRANPVPRMAAHLRGYYHDFVARYGMATVVPLTIALDAERGIGAPATYERPVSPRRQEGELRPQTVIDADEARSRHLRARLQDAWMSGAEELRLTEDDLRAMRPGDAPSAGLPYEFGFHLLAGSTAALDEGDFELIWAPYLGATQLLTGFGRFFHLLDRAAVTETLGHMESAAHVSFHVPSIRATNVARHAAVFDRTIHVGTFHDPTEPGVVDLAGLGVCADHERLRLVSMETGDEVVPRAYTMLNPHATNNVVRFLREFAPDRERTVWNWSWGPFEEFPYLPRVTHGRTTLAKAQWTPPAGLAKAPERDRVIGEWRERMRVPSAVQLAMGDQRIALDLDVASHRDLLAWHCRRPGALIYENRESLAENLGWCDGRAHEIYLPLRPTAPSPSTGRPLVTVRHQPDVHRPGGHWYYAKIYVSADLHDSVLRGPVRHLIDELPGEVDRWFFIRYGDAAPHLRLRIHCPDLDGAAEVRRLAERHLRAMCEHGQAAHFLVDTYAPEFTRYGGPGLMPAAERLFCADSRAVLDLLSAPERELGGLTRSEIGVLAILTIAELIAPGEEASWLVAHLPQGAETKRRREVRSRIEAVLHAPPPEPARILGALRAAGLDYGERVRRLGDPRVAADIGLALAHMHFNRLVNMTRSRGDEDEGLVLARHLAKHALGAGLKLRMSDVAG